MPSGTGPAWPPQVTPAGSRVSHTIYTTKRERQPAWASRFSLIVRLWRFGRPLWSSGGWAGRAVKRSKIENYEILLPWPPRSRRWMECTPRPFWMPLVPSPATRRLWQEDLRIFDFRPFDRPPSHFFSSVSRTRDTRVCRVKECAGRSPHRLSEPLRSIACTACRAFEPLLPHLEPVGGLRRCSEVTLLAHLAPVCGLRRCLDEIQAEF